MKFILHVWYIFVQQLISKFYYGANSVIYIVLFRFFFFIWIVLESIFNCHADAWRITTEMVERKKSGLVLFSLFSQDRLKRLLATLIVYCILWFFGLGNWLPDEDGIDTWKWRRKSRYRYREKSFKSKRETRKKRIFFFFMNPLIYFKLTNNDTVT